MNMPTGKEIQEGFILFQEDAIARKGIATPQQLEVMASCLEKCKWNMANPECKMDMTEEENACFRAATHVYADVLTAKVFGR